MAVSRTNFRKRIGCAGKNEVQKWREQNKGKVKGRYYLQGPGEGTWKLWEAKTNDREKRGKEKNMENWYDLPRSCQCHVTGKVRNHNLPESADI